MDRYTRDGGVIPSGIPITPRQTTKDFYNNFGLYKGKVIDVIYPEDPRNTSDRIEYVIEINGQRYPNAVDVRKRGAIYNYEERIRKHREKAFNGKLDDSTYQENFDSEMIYVLFLNGDADLPIIIGSAIHPRHSDYKTYSHSDGKYEAEEFNGVEVKIDKDSNYSITQVGRKSPGGAIENAAGQTAAATLYGNGDIEFTSYGSAQDLRMKFNKASKKLEMYAQDNKIIADFMGILIEDKNGNSVTLDPSGIVVEDLSGNSVTLDPAGIVVEDFSANIVTLDAFGIEVEDLNANIATLSSDGIKVEDTNGNILEMDSTQVKIESPKIAFGNSTTELLNTVILSLTQCSAFMLESANETHIGFLGITTSPPLNSGQYATIKGLLDAQIALLTAIKGTI